MLRPDGAKQIVDIAGEQESARLAGVEHSARLFEEGRNGFHGELVKWDTLRHRVVFIKVTG